MALSKLLFHLGKGETPESYVKESIYSLILGKTGQEPC